jgi:hypothetical protein
VETEGEKHAIVEQNLEDVVHTRPEEIVLDHHPKNRTREVQHRDNVELCVPPAASIDTDVPDQTHQSMKADSYCGKHG